MVQEKMLGKVPGELSGLCESHQYAAFLYDTPRSYPKLLIGLH